MTVDRKSVLLAIRELYAEEDVREVLDLLYEISISSYDALAKHVRDHEYKIVDEEGGE